MIRQSQDICDICDGINAITNSQGVFEIHTIMHKTKKESRNCLSSLKKGHCLTLPQSSIAPTNHNVYLLSLNNSFLQESAIDPSHYFLLPNNALR
jgi:hypothetical protein